MRDDAVDHHGAPPIATVERLSPQRAKVLEYKSGNPNATARECATGIGMPIGSVRQQLGLLRSAGLIPGRVVCELGPQRAIVFEHMTAHPRATARECAAATGLSFSSVRQHQFRLRTAGLIPLAAEGAWKAGGVRRLLNHHGRQCDRIRAELGIIAEAEAEMALLLTPAARRRSQLRLRHLQQRLRHHETRRQELLELLEQEAWVSHATSARAHPHTGSTDANDEGAQRMSEELKDVEAGARARLAYAVDDDRSGAAV